MSDIEPELAAKLLRSEYPDEMAARSCTCEPDAMCGAHRLLLRYMDLYEQMGKNNERHRGHRNRLQGIIDDPVKFSGSLRWQLARSGDDPLVQRLRDLLVLLDQTSNPGGAETVEEAVAAIQTLRAVVVGLCDQLERAR